jgi:hypothetical protein
MIVSLQRLACASLKSDRADYNHQSGTLKCRFGSFQHQQFALAR